MDTKYNEEYKEGYAMGMVSGDKDSGLLLPAYPYTTEGTETYQKGFTTGYFMQYTHVLSTTLKSTQNPEIANIVATRLEEISECMKIENNKKNVSTK